ncbi:unnamed protein product [Arabidopsis halleri]
MFVVETWSFRRKETSTWFQEKAAILEVYEKEDLSAQVRTLKKRVKEAEEEQYRV